MFQKYTRGGRVKLKYDWTDYLFYSFLVVGALVFCNAVFTLFTNNNSLYGRTDKGAENGVNYYETRE